MALFCLGYDTLHRCEVLVRVSALADLTRRAVRYTLTLQTTSIEFKALLVAERVVILF